MGDFILGETGVGAIYLGNTLIVGNGGVTITASPIIFNFTIEDAQPTRVYFDSSEIITATNITGFTASNHTISSITIQSGLTTGHYFTVTAAFNFYDNDTIRYEGGSDIADLDSNGLYDFTMEYISNNISEPTTSTDKYVNTSSQGSGDGSSEANASTLAYAMTNAAGGETWWIKAGDYGSTQHILSNSGTNATTPIKFIGYKATIGDITTPLVDTFTYTSSANAESQIDSTEYPVLSGTNVASSEGILINGKSNVIFKNIQIEKYSYCTFTYNAATNILFENCTAALSYFGTGDGLGFFIGATSTATKVRYKNCLSFDNGGVNYRSYGEYQAYIGCKSYGGKTGDASTDYHFNLQKSDNTIHYDCEAHRPFEITHGSHGFGIKSGGAASPCTYNLFQNNRCYGIQDEVYYAAHQETKYNVFKNNTGYNDPAWTVDGVLLVARNGAYDNVFENNYGENYLYGIYMYSNTEDQPIAHGSVATNNVFRNNVFNNILNGIVNSNIAGNGDYNITNNKIYNNTFYLQNLSYGGVFYNTAASPNDLIFSGNEVKNNIFYGQYNNTTVYKGNAVLGDYLQQYNDYYRTVSTPVGTGNISVDPDFVDTSDFVPQNNLLNSGLILADIDYDINSNERSKSVVITEKLTIGAVEIDK